ncbi:flagellar basal body P-ring protein FlgI [Microbulbifer rhizosphaerae]|uniref:Flagellar P-ring protein n=1 Tax=Microbulbifer rhizosphaerae TaxID=1562603 RepID=A0A7W4WGR9_9GAMM|nr:flagellar basal body P-ring protein FlgI [Microbulbifer rhizosphaerae]MBB3063487.1 flagellar P-ring protein precursor FlgI [Microbulbifer rhizosphaerae]
MIFFNSKLLFIIAYLLLSSLLVTNANASVRLKEFARVEGVRDNALVGYGLVAGLAGTGDTRRSDATVQSIINTLARFNVIVDERDISSRNVAAVMVTATLPSFVQSGDKIDINIASVGDARSLIGGTLLMTPLTAANGRIYALAQGPVSVGGYAYGANGNVIQKNHPTVGVIANGATVEREVETHLVESGKLSVLLSEPDFTTAARVKEALSENFPNLVISTQHAGKINIQIPHSTDVVDLIAKIENISITPDLIARIVVNERTGTVVSGGNVRLDAVSISHGNIELNISTDYAVSQPNIFALGLEESNIADHDGNGISTVVIPQTNLSVREQSLASVSIPSGSTVNDLVRALKQINVSTRDMIAILQAVKSAGALHAQLVVK